MALDAEDEARVAELEIFKAAMEDYINTRMDFDARQFINQKIDELTPPEE